MTQLPPPHAAVSVRLRASRAAIESLRAAILAGEPWALADAFGTEPEASWGPREVLAHTAEMLPFWLGEHERVLEAGRPPRGPVAFGRTADNPLRIGVLERDRTLPLRELFGRIDAGIGRWDRRLAELAPSEEDEARGRHSTLGDMTAGQLRDRFVVTHLEEHIRQLEEILRRG